MRRRDVIKGTAASGLAIVVGEHEAQAQAELVPVFVTWLWSCLTPEQQSDVKSYIGSHLAAAGRKFASVVGRTAIGGRTAVIGIRFTKSANGLRMDGQLNNMSGNGPPHAVHSGSAPHHKHPDMIGHLGHIVRKSDGWLRQHNM